MVARFKSKRFCLGILIIVNGLIYLPCFTYNYLQDPDEFTSIAFPVYLSGGDWSDIIANTGKWHGYGHVLIFAPFFRLCKTWGEMYNVCRIGSLITWTLLAILIFHMASKYFKLGNEYSLLVSLICTMGNLKPDYGIGLSVMTELPMGIISVFIVFLLIKIDIAAGIKKRIYSFCLFFLLFYSLSIHSRVIALILAVVLFIAVAKILQREMIVSPVFSIMGGGIGCISYKLWNQFYVNAVLTTSEGIRGSVSNNISSVQSDGIEKLCEMFSSLENLKLVIEIFFSLLSGFTILSFGLIGLFAVIDILVIVEVIRHRQKIVNSLTIGCFIGLFSFLLMNGLIAIQSYKTVLSGDRRWYIYLRYAIPFAIIMVFTGVVAILKKKCDIKKALLIATIINIGMILFFLEVPLQELKNTGIMGNLSNVFRQYFYNKENVDAYFFKMIIIALSLWLFIAYFLRKDKQIVVWCSYILVSIIFTVSSFFWHYNKAQTVYTYTDASEKIIKLVEDESKPFTDMKIYSCDTDESFHRYLRVSCPWNEIHYISEEKLNTIDRANSIVLSGRDGLEKAADGLYKCLLDNNEFLYINNADIFDWLSAE